jgi:cation:H+ antiporter
MDVIRLIIGVALLLGGGEAVVRGAAALARKLDISPLAISPSEPALRNSR